MASRLKRILVVDDEQLIRDIVSKMLTGSGFEVTVADTAYEGLDLFHKKEFDLVITDLEMPGMNGWSLASQIKEGAPEIPVVLITGSIRNDIEEKKRKLLVDWVLHKPFRWFDLNNAVKTLLSRRYHYEKKI